MFTAIPYYEHFQFMSGDKASFEVDESLVFVLMPFGKSMEERERLSALYRTIKEVVEKACFNGGRLNCTRADFEEGQIVMPDVCRVMKKASLCLFDISMPNANVYFELGLACALDKRCVLLVNKHDYYVHNQGENIPFDINQFRYVEYASPEDLKAKLRRKVESQLSNKSELTPSVAQINSKIRRLLQHFELETRAERLQEEYSFSEFEIDRACDVLDEYLNVPTWEKLSFQGIPYDEVEHKIRRKLGSDNWSRVKAILKYLYYSGQYKPLIAGMDRIPAELFDVKRDFKKELCEEE